MKYLKKAFVPLLAALLLSSFSALARSENADPAIPGNISEIIIIEQEETGAADSFVRYPDVGTMIEENAPVIEAINQAIQEKARIPEYLQLLFTIQEGSTGLRFDYEITCPCNPWDAPLMNDSRYLSLLFSAEDNDRIADISTDIIGLAEEKRAEWLARGGVENEWEDYLARLDAMGLQEYIDIYQKTYDVAFGQ